MLGIGDIVICVANLGADGANANTIDHLTSVTVVPIRVKCYVMEKREGNIYVYDLDSPVLVHKFLLGLRVGAELVAEAIVVRILAGGIVVSILNVVNPI